MYKLTKSKGQLLVQYSQSALKVVALASILLTVALIARSFVDPAALKGLFASILFFVISIVMMRNASYIFDTNTRMLSFHVRGPLFRNRQGQIPFDQIKDIDFECYRDSDGDGYRIVLQLSDQNFSLSDSYDAKEPQLECFKQLYQAVFERLPDMEKINTPKLIESKLKLLKTNSNYTPTIRLEDYSSEQVLELVQQRKLIDAIKLVRSETGCGLKEAKEYVDKLVK